MTPPSGAGAHSVHAHARHARRPRRSATDATALACRCFACRRSSLDVVFLETLVLSFPLFALHAALAFGALHAAPVCRAFGPEVSPIVGSDTLERSCLLHVGVQHGSSAYLLHAACACALLSAVLYDGWACTVRLSVSHGSMFSRTDAPPDCVQSGWRLWWSQLPVVLYGAALTPLLLADDSLLYAVVGLYTLQFALESITGQHRFLSALQKGSVMSACYISPLGTPKVVLAMTAWLCHSVVFARFHAARRALARPIRMWWEALPVLQTALSAASKADMAVLALCAALSLVTLALSEPDELCRWFGNLLMVMWGGAFGLRFAASSLLQVRGRRWSPACAQRCGVLLTHVPAQLSLDTRGKNVLACLCCRGMLGCATFSALLLLRRCLLTAHPAA